MAASTMVRPLTRWHWLAPVLILTVGTIAVWIGDLDRRVAAHWYVPSDPTAWPLGYREPWHFLYRWSVTPAIALGAAGLLVYAVGCLRTTGRAWRHAGLMLVISLALGPALMVNGILHETWGRPRPRQVTEFGGTKTFLPVLMPAFNPTSQSFPTGHAAGGLAVMALYFVLRERRPVLAWGALATGLGLGGVTAVARIAQGGHWLSDGLWSAGIVYLAAWSVAEAMQAGPREPSPLQIRPVLAALSIAGAVALCVGYLANLPLLERIDRTIDVPPKVKDLTLDVTAPGLEVHTLPGPGPDLHATVTWSGRSAPGTKLEDVWEPAQGSPTSLTGSYHILATGYRRKQNLELWITAPPTLRVTVHLLPPPGSDR